MEPSRELPERAGVKLARAKETAIKAEISNFMKSGFMAQLSHELRNPMNGVLGMLRLLGESDLSEMQHEHIDSALRSAEKVLAVVKQVPEFIFLDVDSLKPEYEPFDLFKAADEVLKLMSGKAAVKNLSLKCEFDDAVPMLVAGDSVKIRQVLAKLVENAINVTERGAVVLGLKVSEVKGNSIVIEFRVTDGGQVLDHDVAEHIFDFTHDNNTGSREDRLRSLELAVCEYMVGLMDGNLGVDQANDSGNVFYIKIPFREVRVEGIKKKLKLDDGPVKPVVDQSAFGGLKILVAEDDPINQSLALAFLGKLGVKVETADDGLEAVKKFKEQNFNLIFMDCEMPEMDGYDATKEIRRLESESGKNKTPIIAMTAYALRGDSDRSMAAGMDGHVPKPVTLEVLKGILQLHLIPDEVGKIGE